MPHPRQRVQCSCVMLAARLGTGLFVRFIGAAPRANQKVPIVPSTAELKRKLASPPPLERAWAAKCSPQ